MTAHLMNISVGPVVDFIEASRRSRDLYMASKIVTEIARAAVKHLSGINGINIIVPAVFDGEKPVTDHILCVLPEGKDPKKVSGELQTVVKGVWKNYADKVYNNKEHNSLGINKDIWDAQLAASKVELFAAWLPFDKSTDNYPTKRDEVERLLAAREFLSEFEPNPITAAGLEKSALDGRWESVLLKEKAYTSARERKFIKPGETLDLQGMVKRLWKDDDGNFHFASVSRIAADPWIRGAESNTERDRWITDHIERINKDTLKEAGIVSQNNETQYSAFPFDGQLLFVDRVKSEIAHFTEQEEEILAALRDVEAHFQRPKEVGKEPQPYLAVISADGDNMGKATKNMTLEEHQAFSKKLTEYAETARCLVENSRYHGSVFYAGGDDLLAFLPLDTAIQCAQELAETFSRIVGGGATLSVGMAIVHMLTPMAGDMVKLANEALFGYAKKKRNTLAIVQDKRSGAPIWYSRPWNEKPAEQIETWIELFKKGDLPHGFAYQLDELARQFTPYKGGDSLWLINVDPEALRAQLRRLIKMKDVKTEVSDNLNDIIKHVENTEQLRELAREIIIAETILKARQDAEGVTK